MTRIFLLLLLLLSTLAFTGADPTEGTYPTDYFRAPVSHMLLLSGTFGELRPNHFHAGIDIKSSRGVAGDAVFAAATGHISRIKVEESGYGRCLYIDHPNGFTTVYAHLDRFSPAIEKFVKEKQYEQQSFEVDLTLGFDEFPLQQGEQLGKMGNTGSSNGAHLHFEVRRTSNQNPINPLLFGFEVADRVPPKMHALKAYVLNEKMETQRTEEFSLLKTKTGDYRLKGDTITLAAWRAGFALKVYDHFDRVSNWNGIYSLKMYRDGELVYDFDMESFSFNETRYINAHCDYAERVSKKSYFNRCFSLPGNKLSIYRKQINKGVVELHADRPSHLVFIAADVAGNEARLEFWAKRSSAPATSVSSETYNYVFPFDEGNMIRTEGLYLHLSKGTLYEDLYLKYRSTPERSHGYYSDVHHVHDSTTPVHQYFDLGIRPTVSIPAELKPKVFVAYCQGSSTWNCGGHWEDGLLRTRVRAFGDYCIMADTQPPVITPVEFSSNMQRASRMRFRITDNVAATGSVVQLTYRATVDGQWVLLEFDRKKDLLTHEFDERIEPGEHTLKLVVTDAVGNEAVYEKKFVR